MVFFPVVVQITHANDNKNKQKQEEEVTGSSYPQSQHESPALNCPLKMSTEFTPLPLHCEH